ncbi:glucuronate isomerase, partial [uncultured Nitratireductor sp.]|uniref:glucuronate isomerase n=1 Tax=uncultured Nitratireductor sp. TaxID=520953 RepID=UPI0025E37E1B
MPLHPDRLFPADPTTRDIAQRLYETVAELPIVSPHGHTEPRWWGANEPFPDPASLIVTPDHYVTRMLISQGVPFEALGIGQNGETDPRAIWRTFASNFHLFRATPSRMWIEHSLETVFGIAERPTAENADDIYETIASQLSTDACRPRALYERFGIAVIATTDSPLDDLRWHEELRRSDWHGHVVPTYRPDSVTDPDLPDFRDNLDQLAWISGIATDSWEGYLDAHRARRKIFRELGATATDHGHATPRTADLPRSEAA